MNVSKISRVSAGGGGIPAGEETESHDPLTFLTVNCHAGSLSWATVHHFDEREAGKNKCVTLHEGSLYAATTGEGVRKWNARTGAMETVLPSSLFSDPIHSLCVVGHCLWVNTGSNTSSGNIVIYDLETGQVKVKAFAAHKSEVTCMAAGPGDKYVVTGGVDFNVKLWTPEGSPIQVSPCYQNLSSFSLALPTSPSSPRLPSHQAILPTPFSLIPPPPHT